MNIAIRVDASLEIGTGHVYRCLSLAGALRKNGARIVFLCRNQVANLSALIRTQQFAVELLPSVEALPSSSSPIPAEHGAPPPAHAHWLGVEQRTDSMQSIQALRNGIPWDLLIVDHYALDFRWEAAMRAVVKRIMVIDDLEDRNHDCDVFLNPNHLDAALQRPQCTVPDHCLMLLGPEYVLLRPEFQIARRYGQMRGNGIARILVYFGGNDLHNLTGLTLEALDFENLRHLLVDVVVGPDNPHRHAVEELVRTRAKTRLHIQPPNFIELLLRADLCIGAGGTTTWERLCVGLPSIIITVAENQTNFARNLHRKNYVTWIGNEKEATSLDIAKAILQEISRLQSLPFITNTITVDGEGASRVAQFIASIAY